MSKGTWILVVCVSMCVGGCAPKSDFLANGDFEMQTEIQKSPTEWYATVIPETKDFVTFKWDDQVAHAGKRSVSIAIAPSHPDKVIAYNWTKTLPGCHVGKSYEMSGWMKTENLHGPAWICVQCWNSAKSEMLGFATTQKDYPVTGTSDWTKVGTVFTIPAGTAEVRIRAGIASPDNNGGQAWFDDLRVREL